MHKCRNAEMQEWNASKNEMQEWRDRNAGTDGMDFPAFVIDFRHSCISAFLHLCIKIAGSSRGSSGG
jgi:hypothetical protein